MLALVSCGVAMMACGGGATGAAVPETEAAAPDPEPDVDVPDTAFKEALETGSDCVTAEADCQGGVCTATVQNNCTTPVTCELNVTVLCRSGTETGEARGKGRDTFAAGTSGELQAGGSCEGRELVGTTPNGMSCK
jgi:hypothetical protein